MSEYGEYLEGKGCTAEHVREALPCVRTVVRGTSIDCSADVDARHVEKCLKRRQEERNRLARTRNMYLVRISSMMTWAVRRGLAVDNPLIVIAKLAGQNDQREISRALTPEEFKRLIDSTPDEERRLYYLMAGRTGLRWQDLFRLTWHNVDSENGWLMVDASNTKSRRADHLPLAGDVLESLRRRARLEGKVFCSMSTLRAFR